MKSAALHVVVLALFVTGCMATPEIKESREAPAENLLPSEAVAVVSLLSGVRTEHAVCVAKTIRKLEKGVKVVTPAAFRDGMFPWFEPGTTPTTSKGLAQLMKRSLVRQKVAEFGVRYVVAIGGKGARRSEGKRWGGMVQYNPGIAEGIMKGAYTGGVNWETSTQLTATVLDLKQKRPVGIVAASASGTDGFGVLLLIPYYIPGPDTATTTCRAISQRVVGFLKGKPQPPDQTNDDQK